MELIFSNIKGITPVKCHLFLSLPSILSSSSLAHFYPTYSMECVLETCETGKKMNKAGGQMMKGKDENIMKVLRPGFSQKERKCYKREETGKKK